MPSRQAPRLPECAGATHAGEAKGSADTCSAEAGALGAGAAGAGLPRDAAGRRAEARGRGHASGSPPGRRAGTDGRPGAAAAAAWGRPEACRSDYPAGSLEEDSLFFFLSFFFFKKALKAFPGLFSFFFFRMLGLKAAEAVATQGRERVVCFFLILICMTIYFGY